MPLHKIHTLLRYIENEMRTGAVFSSDSEINLNVGMVVRDIESHFGKPAHDIAIVKQDMFALIECVLEDVSIVNQPHLRSDDDDISIDYDSDDTRTLMGSPLLLIMSPHSYHDSIDMDKPVKTDEAFELRRCLHELEVFYLNLTLSFDRYDLEINNLRFQNNVDFDNLLQLNTKNCEISERLSSLRSEVMNFSVQLHEVAHEIRSRETDLTLVSQLTRGYNIGMESDKIDEKLTDKVKFKKEDGLVVLNIPQAKSEVPDKATEIPDKATKIPDKATGVSDKATELSDKATGVSDKTTEVSDKTILDVPDKTGSKSPHIVGSNSNIDQTNQKPKTKAFETKSETQQSEILCENKDIASPSKASVIKVNSQQDFIIRFSLFVVLMILFAQNFGQSFMKLLGLTMN